MMMKWRARLNLQWSQLLMKNSQKTIAQKSQGNGKLQLVRTRKREKREEQGG
ncbi:hypothetical protein DPMN_080638 [Dreissena polymorpha]|uniref:Uncharacterized protein n=1 Tax=Dreissena polymorpha TaxID=45954 RepID=A0A9D3YT33_DREPO|nr:hypothetical protein DPMN_080638 [Dreissena polymorpha]